MFNNVLATWQTAIAFSEKEGVSVSSILVRLTGSYRLSGRTKYDVVCSSHNRLNRKCQYCTAVRRYQALMTVDRIYKIPHLPLDAFQPIT